MKAAYVTCKTMRNAEAVSDVLFIVTVSMKISVFHDLQEIHRFTILKKKCSMINQENFSIPLL